MLQREFTRSHRRDQSELETLCPSVFVLRPYSEEDVRINRWMNIARTKMELQLYCEEPGCWHPTYQGGQYVIDKPAAWLQTVAPYVRCFVGVLKWVSPLCGPGPAVCRGRVCRNPQERYQPYGCPGQQTAGDRDHRSRSLPDTGKGQPRADRVEGAALRTLHKLRLSLDPRQEWGNLSKVLTPEGDYLWLCEMHARRYR